MITTSRFSNNLVPGIKAAWFEAEKRLDRLWPKVFTKETTKRQWEEFQENIGFAITSSKAQGQSVTFDEAYQGYKHTIVQSTFGLGFSVSLEMKMFDQYNTIKALPSLLTESNMELEEVSSFNILNRAFSSSYTGVDGKSLCATDHPTGLGGTFSNRLATSVDLSLSGIEAMDLMIRNAVDSRGLHMRIAPKQLIVPNDLRVRAMTILGTDRLVGSNYNDKNVFYNYLPILPVPYLTDSKAWFMQTTAKNGLMMMVAMPWKMSSDVDFGSDSEKFKTVGMFAPGYANRRSLYGSAGV